MVNNSAACDDGEACSHTDLCSDGACAGTTYACDDANPCTDDACTGDGECVFANNAAPCSDGDPCTTDDTCAGGTCGGVAVPGDGPPAYDAFDSFARPNSLNLGKTEVGGFPWAEVNAPDTSYASIQQETLRVHYFAGGPSAPNQWVTLGEVLFADGVIDARVKTLANYNGRVSLSYRKPGQPGYKLSGGYHLAIGAKAIRLYAGHLLRAEVAAEDDNAWHDFRVVVNGDQHCIFKDGALVLSVQDGIYPNAGYAGVETFYSIANFDNFGVSVLADGKTDPAAGLDVYDDFERPDDPVVGAPPVGDFLWTEAGDATSPHVQIASGRLYTHYFLDGSVPQQYANLSGFEAGALELTFRARGIPAYMSLDRPFGVSYRLPSDTSNGHSPGYHVHITEQGVALFAGKTEVAAGLLPIDTGWHDYRVVAVGPSHRIFVDGVLMVDALDDTHLQPGVAGIFASYSVARFEHVGIRTLEPKAIYPRAAAPGLTEFPFGMYSVEYGFPEAAFAGFNAAQTYGMDKASHLADAGAHRLPALVGIGTYHVNDADPPPISTEDQVQGAIAVRGAFPNLAWWAYPEELRFWRADELAEMQNLFKWTRQYDPLQRPTYMYNPNHRTAAALAEVVPYLDLIGKGSYVELAGHPRAWVRHQLESTVESIALTGATVGPDYLAGQKVPVAILMAGIPAVDAANAYHDVYSGIASGALAVFVWSYFNGLKPEAGDGLDGYAKAASELTGPDNPLGTAILFGAVDAGVGFEITTGPLKTVPFTPFGFDAPVINPCLNVRAWNYAAYRIVVAVNSCEEPIEATLTGLGAADEAVVLFENRTVLVDAGAMSEPFAALGVHIYRLDE